jgi:hypothetical protein
MAKNFRYDQDGYRLKGLIAGKFQRLLVLQKGSRMLGQHVQQIPG